MDRWAVGELAFWLSMVGEIEAVHDASLEPFVLLDRNNWNRAAALWDERGIPTSERCVSASETSMRSWRLYRIASRGLV